MVVSLHVCGHKLMVKRTCAAKATAKQGGIECNDDMVQIQSLHENCAICKLLCSPSLAQDLAPRRARRACEQAEQSQCVGTPQPWP
jgi:hypothetical protein